MIVSRYSGVPPTSNTPSARTIAGGPLYSKEDVLPILELGESAIVPWTQKCASDLKKYELDHSDVIHLINLALAKGEFKGSEWCINKPGGAWAA